MTPIRGAPYDIDQGLNLTQAGLGRFLCALLRHGGDVRSFFVPTPNVPRSIVCARVVLPPANKAAFEAETGLTLRPPARLSTA